MTQSIVQRLLVAATATALVAALPAQSDPLVRDHVRVAEPGIQDPAHAPKARKAATDRVQKRLAEAMAILREENLSPEQQQKALAALTEVAARLDQERAAPQAPRSGDKVAQAEALGVPMPPRVAPPARAPKPAAAPHEVPMLAEVPIMGQLFRAHDSAHTEPVPQVREKAIAPQTWRGQNATEVPRRAAAGEWTEKPARVDVVEARASDADLRATIDQMRAEMREMRALMQQIRARARDEAPAALPHGQWQVERAPAKVLDVAPAPTPARARTVVR